MSRRLVFHYARPDGIYDDWFLVATNGANVDARQDGPFGVVWHVELHDDATAFTYQLQRPVTATTASSEQTTGQEQYGQALDRVKTDPAGNQDQTVLLEQDDTEVVYPSGFAWRKKAYTLQITSPDIELQVIREKLDQVITDVGNVHGAVTGVDSKVSVLDNKSDFIATAAADIDIKINILDEKSDLLVTAATDLDGKVTGLDGKSDALLAAATGLDGKTSTLQTTANNIDNNVGKLLSQTGVIIFGGQTQAPNDVEQFAKQAVAVVSDVVTGLETARTTFTSKLGLPPIPADSPAPDLRGQAVQQIVEHLFFAQAAGTQQLDRLQQLVNDGAARREQDLVALRAELITTADQLDSELLHAQTLAQSDPADLELVKTLSGEIRPKLIEMRVLAQEVAP
jgi:hypothetical protein